MSYHGLFEEQKNQKPKKPMKKGKKILLIVLAVLVVLIAGIGTAVAVYLNKMGDRLDIIELPEDTYVYTEEATEPGQTETGDATEAAGETTIREMTADDIINILVVGQASRAGEEGHMADTTILASINTYTNTITLSSIYRDAYVRIPAYKGHTEGRNKFTVVYNLGYLWGGGTAGAMEMTNICLKDNFGIEVDYNFEISFDSFIRIIDFIGGVKLDITEAEAEYLNADDLYVKYDIEPGEQYLDGMAALSYARMRKAEGDNDSDIVRTGRQRKLIVAALERVSNNSLKDLKKIVDILLDEITTTMKPSEIAKLMVELVPKLPTMTIEGGTIPVEGTYRGEMVDIYSDGGSHSVLKFDSAQQKKLVRAITEAEGIE